MSKTIFQIFKGVNSKIFENFAEAYKIAKEEPKNDDDFGTFLETSVLNIQNLIHEIQKDCEIREKQLLLHINDLEQEIKTLRKQNIK